MGQIILLAIFVLLFWKVVPRVRHASARYWAFRAPAPAWVMGTLLWSMAALLTLGLISLLRLLFLF